MDLEWDADYDFKTKRLDASNIFADYRRDSVFGSVGYSTLQALDASFTATLASQVTKYNLLRLLLGYGDPTKRGLSIGVNAGYDFIQNALQYGGIQSSYNWDCCGSSVEYRRLALGSVRNENQYSFNFTLAGVGAAGNSEPFGANLLILGARKRHGMGRNALMELWKGGFLVRTPYPGLVPARFPVRRLQGAEAPHYRIE